MDVAPTQLEKPLLEVLDKENITKKIKDARQESRVRTATKITIRAVAFNLDFFVMVFCLFFAGLVGFSLAKTFGLSTQQITTHVEDYIYFFLYILITVFSTLVKLATKSGLISKTLQTLLESRKKRFAEWLKEITTPKTDLKWNVLTTQLEEKKTDEK